MTLLASPLGGVVAIALGQRVDGLGLSDISRAVEATPSSVQRALESTDDLLRPELATRRTTVPVAKLEHDELLRRLPDEPNLRDRAAPGEILKGTIARSFQDP